MIVLDSSFLIAFHNTRDAHHTSAKQAMSRFLGGRWGEGLLPEYVFLEVVTVLARRLDAPAALAVAELLNQSRELELVPCSPYFAETLQEFHRHAHIGLSFADAAIVAIARARGAERIATFDAGFRKMRGLSVVPR